MIDPSRPLRRQDNANEMGRLSKLLYELVERIADEPPGRMQSEWQPISSAPRGPKLLVAYRNRLGKWRRVLATYYGFQELESIDQGSEDGYAPEGWYEACEASEEIMRTDEEPEFWQALPPHPVQ